MLATPRMGLLRLGFRVSKIERHADENGDARGDYHQEKML